MHERLQHIREVCRQRATIRRARSYLSVLLSPPPIAEYACAYLASEHLQNADALVSRAATRGGLKAKAFWRLVGDVERALILAARNKAALPSGRTFTYKRLPRYRPRCKACLIGGLPCLVARRMSGYARRRPSDKCQVCFIRKAKCERDEPKPAVNHVLQPRNEVQDEFEITGWRLGGGPLQRTDAPRIDEERRPVLDAEPTVDSGSRAPSPDDEIPVNVLFGKGKAREQPPVVTSPKVAAAPSSIPAKRPHAPPHLDPSKRRRLDENAAPSPVVVPISHIVPSPRIPAAAASSSNPPATGSGDTPGQYLALVYDKALDIVRHAAHAGGTLPLEVRVPIREMSAALAEPELAAPRGEHLKHFEGERLRAACTLVQAAVRDVAALDQAAVADVGLRWMLRSLKGRVGDLGRVCAA